MGVSMAICPVMLRREDVEKEFNLFLACCSAEKNLSFEAGICKGRKSSVCVNEKFPCLPPPANLSFRTGNSLPFSGSKERDTFALQILSDSKNYEIIETDIICHFIKPAH